MSITSVKINNGEVVAINGEWAINYLLSKVEQTLPMWPEKNQVVNDVKRMLLSEEVLQNEYSRCSFGYQFGSLTATSENTRRVLREAFKLCNRYRGMILERTPRLMEDGKYVVSVNYLECQLFYQGEK